MNYFVYILASKKNGILYVGITNNLKRRIYEHKTGVSDSFTRRYFISRLVWFDWTNSVESAINREKQIKKWKRDWKIELIEKTNPEWNDLLEKI